MTPQVSSRIGSTAAAIVGNQWVAPNCFAMLSLAGSTTIDPGGAGHRRAPHRVGADAAAPDDDDGLPRPHVGDLRRGPETGGNAAGQQGGVLQRDVVTDLHGLRLVHRDVGRERAEQRHRRGALALDRRPERVVGDRDTAHDLGAEIADVRLAAGAPHAAAAGRDEHRDDVVALLQRGHVRSDGLVRRPRPRGRRAAGSWAGASPARRCSSEWHIPADASRIRTSPATGSPISSSSMVQGSPGPQQIAPLVFTVISFTDRSRRPWSG